MKNKKLFLILAVVLVIAIIIAIWIGISKKRRWRNCYGNNTKRGNDWRARKTDNDCFVLYKYWN